MGPKIKYLYFTYFWRKTVWMRITFFLLFSVTASWAPKKNWAKKKIPTDKQSRVRNIRRRFSLTINNNNCNCLRDTRAEKKKHKSSTNCLRADRDVCASAATFWNRWYVHCGCIVCARWRPIFEIIIIIIICNIAVTRVRDKEASQAPPLRISFLPRAPPRTSTTIMNISDTCVPLVHRTLTSI